MAGGTWTKIIVYSVYFLHYFVLKKIDKCRTTKYSAGGHSVHRCTFNVHSIMYVLLLLLCLPYVHMYIVTCRHNLSLRSHLRSRIGDPNGPLFYPALRGLLLLRPGSRTRAPCFPLDPGSTCTNVYIYPRPPVASYSNPKDSISSSPAFLYCIMCTCICFMLFRSTCLWPFSEENPLRVASEALNIHLVSCILRLKMPPGLAWSRWRNLYSTVQNRFLGKILTDAEKYRYRYYISLFNYIINITI